MSAQAVPAEQQRTQGQQSEGPRTPATEQVVAFHREVTGLCVERLSDALNADTGLFDRQLRDKVRQPTIGTEDLTSTGICLIGLHRAGIEPARIKLDPAKTLSALFDVTRRRRYAGGFGLVLWANAVWNGAGLDTASDRSGVALSLLTNRLESLTTMELAWLASGLLHEHRRASGGPAGRHLTLVLAELHERHHRKTGLFWHASERAPVKDRLRRAVPNFADQIYSVQASAFAAASGFKPDALHQAEAAAARLTALQGERGQWWWHYDPRRGRVASGFPVYSVHQHAMAPMALLALAAAGGSAHRAPVEASYRWLRNNELGTDLVDTSAGTIWRDIEPELGRVARAVRNARSVIGWTPSDGGTRVAGLKVNYETRPYEWAWCLYAGALAAGEERAEHIV